MSEHRILLTPLPAIVLYGMSFVMGVKTDNPPDVILLADGLELDTKTGKPTPHDFVKTLRLNDNVCVGFAGDVQELEKFLPPIIGSRYVRILAEDWPITNHLDRHWAGLPDHDLTACIELFKTTLQDAYGHLAKCPLQVLVGGAIGGLHVLGAFSKEPPYCFNQTRHAVFQPLDFTPSAEYSTPRELYEHFFGCRVPKYAVNESFLKDVLVAYARHYGSVNCQGLVRKLSGGFIGKWNDWSSKQQAR